ncbi:MAG: glycosyltransferase family 4 protein [Gammaproteobacteria bacterium]
MKDGSAQGQPGKGPRRKERLSVALVRQSHSDVGGAEQAVRSITRALGALDAEVRVSVIARNWPVTDGIEVLNCDAPASGRAQRDRQFRDCACTTVERGGFDLVQSHERIPCCDIYRAGDGVHREWLIQRGRVSGPLRRLATRLSDFHRQLLKAERVLYASPRLKAVICNSHMVAGELQAHYGVSPDKVHVIHNAVDGDRFHPRLRAEHREAVLRKYAIGADEDVALFLGSGYERKGLKAVLEALALLVGEVPAAPRLLVVGKDSRMGRYQRLARRLGVEDRVVFAGAQPDPRPYLGAADMLVFPTLYDPFPNVVMEAMACALPVITSDKCGATDIIDEGRNGLVCDALDIPTIARHMHTLLDPQRRDAIGRAARATVEPMNHEAMGKRLMALYADVLK